MQNNQTIETRTHREDGILDVHSIFYTIQGEGPFTGWPSVFVRLAGCNLQCPLCDTDYTSHREFMHPSGILSKIKSLIPNKSTTTPLVVLTGGEPFRQNLQMLLTVLNDHDFNIQIETNGIVNFKEIHNARLVDAHIVCSPKVDRIDPDIINEQVITDWKYIIRHGEVENGRPTKVLGRNIVPYFPTREFLMFPDQTLIYVQPLDEQDKELNQQNLETTRDLAMEYGYILGTQFHKELELP